MRHYILLIIGVVVFGLSSGITAADTFTIETTTDDVTSISTVTIDAPVPSLSAQSVSEAIASLLQEMGGIDILAQIQLELEQLTLDAIEVVTSDPVDADKLGILAASLGDLALRLQVYILKQQVLELSVVDKVKDGWSLDKVFNNYQF